MKTFQARLVFHDKIQGFIKAENGQIMGKAANSDKWFEWGHSEIGSPRIIIPFNQPPEPLAPFKDKDGGELYAGDIVILNDDGCLQGVLVCDGMMGWHIEMTDSTPCVLTTDTITKLGTIHDAGKGE